jgi:2-polyprenyl-6-methoxyphenol hydroxylase-like FAD-dependent oxidoreductase
LAIFAATEHERTELSDKTPQDMLHRLFDGMGWRAPELLASLDCANDIFFGAMSRATVPNWWTGRVALVVDPAGGVSIGGMGAGVAIVGAYVLAAKLITEPSDFASAFARYQSRVSLHAIACATKGENSSRFLVPRSAPALTLRNAVFSFPPVKALMIKLAYQFSAALALLNCPSRAH